jgi:hypothetical protein
MAASVVGVWQGEEATRWPIKTMASEADIPSRVTEMRHVVPFGLGLLFLGAAASAQAPTLRERVNRAQADVDVLVSCDSPARLPFAELLATTHHIVRSTVGSSVTRLTDDGDNIYTTFELSNQNVIFSRKASPSQFGSITPILTVTQQGGSVILDGFKATVTFRCENEVKLNEGMDVVLLLREFNGGHWSVGADGAFEIRDSKVIPLDKQAGDHQKFAGMSVGVFLKELSDMRRRSQK